MSVTFFIANDRHDCLCELDCDVCRPRVLNVHNANGAELLSALQIGTADHLPGGEVRGRELASACRRVLADHNFDVIDRIPGGERLEPAALGGRLIQTPRPSGRLREHVEKLLHIAELAGDLGRVAWG
jgi:hypothetical protein